jgi:hypothetical protein
MPQDTQNQGQPSPFNFDPQVRSSFHIPGKVRVHDVTLRDGEQAPGVVFDRADRLRIAKARSHLCVPVQAPGCRPKCRQDGAGRGNLRESGARLPVFG